jgi:DNA-binding IclR family transcriptional regulator
LTEGSIGSLKELRKRLVAVRESGYAVDDGETVRGMICIGAPVRDDAGGTVGAVAVSMPKGAHSNARLKADAADLRGLADEISRGLGAP